MDDWLKYNASEYTVNGKTYRNLEAQVLKNKEDIENLDISGIEDDIEALQDEVAGKQDELTAGSNITISEENVISATDTTYTPGNGISISAQNEISSTVHGIPVGGTTGQVLAKVNGDDYNVEWVNQSGGSVDVFWVTPNTTTYAQITTALSENKLPLINASGIIYVFNCDTGNDSYLFANADVMQKQFLTYTVTDANVWSTGSRSMQDWYINTAEVTIQTSDWTLLDGYYIAAITLSGMTVDAAVVWASPKAYADCLYWAEYKLFCYGHASNLIRFITDNASAPAHNIKVNVVWTAEAS